MYSRRRWAITWVVVFAVAATVFVATARTVTAEHQRSTRIAAVAASTDVVPDTAVPDTAVPDTAVPDTAVPDTAAPAPQQTGSDTGVDATASATATQAAVAAVDAVDADTAGSDLGTAVLDRDTDTLAVGANGAQRFYAASVVKLYTVVDILHRRESGAVQVTDADLDLIKRALSSSDDQAMNALWSAFGGSQTVSDTIALVGMQDSAPPTDPSQWGETMVSARDVVALYDYAETSLSPEDRDLVLGALRNAQDTGADGFDQAFGLIDPPRTTGTAAKQGWMWIGSQFYLHTSGVVGDDDRYAVVVLSRNPASIGQEGARTLVDKATAAAEAQLDL